MNTFARMFFSGIGCMAGALLAILGFWLVVEGVSTHASDTPALMGNVFFCLLGAVLAVVGFVVVAFSAAAATAPTRKRYRMG